jgi:hypothetical protein
MGGNYNYFDGITVRSTQVAFRLGIKGIAASTRRPRFADRRPEVDPASLTSRREAHPIYYRGV